MHRHGFTYALKRIGLLSAAVATAACGGDGSTATPPEPSARINDTGLTTCVNSSLQAIPCADSAAQAEFYGQDGNFGRDARAVAGTLNKQGGGTAAFDFSKRGATGEILDVQDQPWAGTGSEASGENWSCVTDHVTGLTWEVKTKEASALRYNDRRLTWYNNDSAINGGDPGAERGGNCAEPEVCNTADYIAALNSQQFCGRSNWRLPTVNELLSIADQSTTNPPLDLDYFPNPSYNAHWTSHTVADDPSSAWYVYFTAAGNGSINKTGQAHIRAVSSDE